MEFVYSDGGRSNYFKGQCGDCVSRAICNATGLDYKEVYDRLGELIKNDKKCQKKGKRSARNGVSKRIIKKYLEQELGLIWVPCMTIGSGCTTHLRKEDMPTDRTIIVSVSKHLTCVKNQVLYDTYDCSRDGNRCVYGYWVVD